MKYYETPSLALAASFICLGISLDSISKIDDGRFNFVFKQSAELITIVEQFWKKSLLIEPNSFWEAQRFLKSRIYNK